MKAYPTIPLKKVKRILLAPFIFVLPVIILLGTAHGSTNATPGWKQSEVLSRALKAHGGLERWQSYGTMEYDLRNLMLGPKAPLNDQHLVDLKGRYHLIRSERYTLGFDGQEGWITPGIETLELPPRFYAFGNLYLWAQPFVLADEGSVPVDAGQTDFEGKTYNVVHIGYGSGDTPDDQYVAYFEPDSGRLHLIIFSVTHPAVLGDKPIEEAPRKALIFKKYQAVGGLLIPQTVGFHDWKDGRLGQGSEFEVVNLSFREDRVERARFKRPAGAFIDKMHIRE